MTPAAQHAVDAVPAPLASMPQASAPPGTSAPPASRILLVRLSALGDILQGLAALAAVRAAYPTGEIGWLVEDRHADVLRDHPQIDRLFVFERGRTRSGLAGSLGAVRDVRRALRAWGPEIAVDLQGNAKSAWLALLSGAPRRICLPGGEARDAAHVLATEVVRPGPEREHRADRALRLVAPLTQHLVAPLTARAAATPVLPPIPAAAQAAISSSLSSRGRFALLLPGTSAFGAFKRWPPAAFGVLAQQIHARHGMGSLVGYGPDQRELADAVVAAARGTAELAPATADILQLRALLERAAVVVGSDSGPPALAALAGVPTVVLFGPKDPVVYGPRGPRTAVVWKQVYCSPCPLRQCGDPICMTTMDPAEVSRMVDALLGDNRA